MSAFAYLYMYNPNDPSADAFVHAVNVPPNADLRASLERERGAMVAVVSKSPHARVLSNPEYRLVLHVDVWKTYDAIINKKESIEYFNGCEFRFGPDGELLTDASGPFLGIPVFPRDSPVPVDGSLRKPPV